MKYRVMGVSGLKVSVLGLGTMNFGHKVWGCDEKNSIEMIDAFIDNGGNFIDTAGIYGNDAESEKILGRALKKGRREELIISTKLAFPMVDATINERGASRNNIIKSVEDALNRLNTDYIDLLYIHIWDPVTPLTETFSTLTNLVKQGKVRYLGASNFTGWQISEAASLWKNSYNFEPFISIQSEYSLINRYVEYEIIPACIYNKIGFVCYSPLGGGVLADIYKKDKSGPKDERYTSKDWWSKVAKDRYLSNKNLEIVDKLKKISEDMKVSLPALSLSWCINKPVVSSVLIAGRNTSQLIENMKAIDVEISSDVMEKMDVISEPFRPYEYSGINDEIKEIFKVIEYKFT